MFRNPYVILFLTLGVLGAVGGYTAFIYHKGKAVGIADCNEEKTDTVNENIKIKEKQDAVMRPSTTAYIDSLRDRSF